MADNFVELRRKKLIAARLRRCKTMDTWKSRKPGFKGHRPQLFNRMKGTKTWTVRSKSLKAMDLPPEYVLHLLPLMAICGLPPPSQNIPSLTESSPERSSSMDRLSSISSTPTLASIPYIEPELGRAILKVIDQWRTLALWEPFASKDRQVPGASIEGMFRVLPVDRVTVLSNGS